MARLWTFAAGLNTLTAGVEFTSGNGSGALSLSAFPSDSGRPAVRANPSAASAWWGQIFKSSASSTQAWARVVIEVGTLPSSATEFAGFWNSGAATRQAYVSIDNSGVVHLRDSAGTAKVTSSALSSGIHAIEFTTTVSAGSASMELVIDGASIGTSATGNTGNYDALYLGTPAGAGTYDIYLSEVAINDSSGSTQTAFPSTKDATIAANTRMVYGRPTSAGSNNAWLKQGGGAGSSTNYQDVDEVTPDDATTYLKRTGTGTKIDDYNLDSASTLGIGASDTITLVAVGVRAGATSATSTNRGGILRITGPASTVVESGTIDWSVNGWITHSDPAPKNYQLHAYVNPDDSAAWAPSDIDGMQIGFKNAQSSTNEIRVSKLWALIEYVKSTSQDVTLPTIASGATLYAMTMTPGTVDVTLPTIASGATTYAPTLAYVVALPTIASGATLYAPTLVPGAVDVTLPTIASGATLYAPTLTVGAVDVTLPTIASGAAIYAPTLAYVVDLPTIASGATLYAPTLTVGAVDVTLPTIASGASLYAMTLTVGAVDVTLPAIASGAALYAPTLTVGAVEIVLPAIASGSTIAAPTLAYVVALPAIASGETLYAPAVEQTAETQDLTLPTIASGVTLYAPTLTVGAVSLTLPTIASGETLYAPTLTVGSVDIVLPTIAAAAVLYAPTLTVGAVDLSLPTIASGETLYAPTLTPGAVTIALPAIASGETLYAPTLVDASAGAAITIWPMQRIISAQRAARAKSRRLTAYAPILIGSSAELHVWRSAEVAVEPGAAATLSTARPVADGVSISLAVQQAPLPLSAAVAITPNTGVRIQVRSDHEDEDALLLMAAVRELWKS